MIPQIASRWYQYEKRWVHFHDLSDFDTTRFGRDTVTEKTLYKSGQTWYIVAGGRYSNRKLYHHMIRKKKSRTTRPASEGAGPAKGAGQVFRDIMKTSIRW